jgi:hypothetical protein
MAAGIESEVLTRDRLLQAMIRDPSHDPVANRVLNEYRKFLLEAAQHPINGPE